VASEIYGVRPLDPLVLGGVMALLTIVALAACAVPARRAMRVDPIVALRSE
jgi:putative ABC transport system permease protein